MCVSDICRRLNVYLRFPVGCSSTWRLCGPHPVATEVPRCSWPPSTSTPSTAASSCAWSSRSTTTAANQATRRCCQDHGQAAAVGSAWRGCSAGAWRRSCAGWQKGNMPVGVPVRACCGLPGKRSRCCACCAGAWKPRRPGTAGRVVCTLHATLTLVGEQVTANTKAVTERAQEVLLCASVLRLLLPITFAPHFPALSSAGTPASHPHIRSMYKHVAG